MSSFAQDLEQLAPEARRRAYEQLWLELTIVGRIVASDSELSESGQLRCLTSLNEIHHRIWGAFTDPGGVSPRDLEAQILHHVAQAPMLNQHLGSAVRRALDSRGTDPHANTTS
ncbi:MAG: hypothetical protein AAF488_01565 [Planctomycetota bacterium]